MILESLLWLTLNVYYEARGDEQLGQIAVAHVTLNRSYSKQKPIKEVVLEPKQFSWTHQKECYWPQNPKAFVKAAESVLIALGGYDFTGGADHYHRVDIKPYWRKSMEEVGVFGKHKFYRRD